MKSRLFLLLAAFISSQAQAFYADVMIQPHNTTVRPNQHFAATAVIQYGIQNNTHTIQEYVIKYSLCPQNKHCLIDEKRIVLKSTQRISDKFTIQVPLVYGQVGGYSLEGKVNIVGESTAKAEGRATITIMY